jgi:hypothetical protein
MPSGRTLLFLVRTYDGEPLDVHSVNSTTNVHGTIRTYATFWNTPWLIPRHMRHFLDRCVKVSDVH